MRLVSPAHGQAMRQCQKYRPGKGSVRVQQANKGALARRTPTPEVTGIHENMGRAYSNHDDFGVHDTFRLVLGSNKVELEQCNDSKPWRGFQDLR